MLRSFDAIRHGAPADRLLVANPRAAAITGGGGRYRTPWHWHDCVMLLFPRHGAMALRGEGRRGEAWLAEDRFALVPRELAHESEAVRADGTHLALYLSDAGVAGFMGRHGEFGALRRARAPLVFAMPPDLRALVALCVSRTGSDRSAPAARTYLVAALFHLVLAEARNAEPMSAATAASHGDAVVAEIEALIRNDPAAEPSLEEIAATFGLSRRHATRLFRDKTGRSIGETREAARLSLAETLLTETDLPIGEIAFRAGYDSGSALARAWRRVRGFSPGAWRAVARSGSR